MMYLLALFILCIDQATKVAFGATALNNGVAFGLASHHNLLLGTMLGFGLIGSVFLYRTSPSNVLNRFTWGIIMGGIMSNLIDRLRVGAVLDPFTIGSLPLSFNVADVAITVGFTLLCVQLFWQRRVR